MMKDYRDQAEFPTSEEEGTTSSSSGEESQPIQGILRSPTTEYWIQSHLGEGTYGQVVKCIKASTRETVAVKILKDNISLDLQNEVDMLQLLSDYDPDRYNFSRFNGRFFDRDRTCLEFEMLDTSLWDFVGTRPTHALSVKEIRPILHQMAMTLELLRNVGIVHTDLKLDNIMLADQANQPWRVKMIDFGVAYLISEAEWGNYVQPRFYRSPEVILGIPFTPAIDMWALGCVAAELFLGHVLFPGNSDYEMLRYMVRTRGNLPQRLLNYGINTRCFFRRKRCRNRRRVWRLMTPREYGDTTWINNCIGALDDLKNVRPPSHLSEEDNMAEMEDRENFIELLKGMLHLDVNKRITPNLLLEDPFITLNDLVENYPNSFYVKSCCELMKVCEAPAQDPWMDTQPSTSTANLHQAPPAWQSHQEHPLILEIASDVSSCLSMEDQGAPQSQRLSLLVDDSEMSPVSSDEAKSSRVIHASKRQRDTSSEEKGPESTPPQSKRMRRPPSCSTRKAKLRGKITFLAWRRRMQKLRDLRHKAKQASSEVPTSSDQIKPQMKWTWDDITEYDVSSTPVTGLPERRMSSADSNEAPTETLSREAETSTRKRRTRRSHHSNKAPTGTSSHEAEKAPKNKKRTRSSPDSNEAPTETSSSETKKAPKKKRRTRSSCDSNEAPTEMPSDEAEEAPKKKRRKTSPDSNGAPTETPSSEAEKAPTSKQRTRSSHDSNDAPNETPSSEAEKAPTRKKRTRSSHDSNEAPNETPSSEAEKAPTSKKRTRSSHDSNEAPNEILSSEAETISTRKRRTRCSHHSKKAPTETSSSETEKIPQKKKRTRCSRDSNEAPTETPSSEAEKAPTRKKRSRTSDDSNEAPTETPSSEAEKAPTSKQRTRSSHDSNEAPNETPSSEAEKAPTRKKRTRSSHDSNEAPTETPSSEAEETQKKKRRRTSPDSNGAPTETPSSEAEKAPTRKKRTRSSHDSNEAPTETPSSEAEETQKKKRRRTSPDSNGAPTETPSSEAEKAPTSKQRTRSSHDSNEAPNKTLSSEAEKTPQKKKRTRRSRDSNRASTETSSSEDIKPPAKKKRMRSPG